MVLAWEMRGDPSRVVRPLRSFLPTISPQHEHMWVPSGSPRLSFLIAVPHFTYTQSISRGQGRHARKSPCAIGTVSWIC